MFSADDIYAAAERIRGVVHKTPVLTCSYIDGLCSGKKIYFKSEHLQKTGSFKARGALNAVEIVASDPTNKSPSVITHSSGNFGQALAWAAKIHNIPCTVVAPNDAPASKLNAMNGYGANIVLCEPKDRRIVCERIRDKQHSEMVDPYDDYRVMAGGGTVAVEFLEQVPDLDALLVAVGGGGFCSGIVVGAKKIKPTIKVYCVEPIGKDLQLSFDSGKRSWNPEAGPVKTIADGIRVLRVGEKCFPPILDLCEKKVLTVNDEEIIRAMEMVYIRMKQVIEPTGAVSLAALLKYLDQLTAYNRIGLIFCGGNVELRELPFLRSETSGSRT